MGHNTRLFASTYIRPASVFLTSRPYGYVMEIEGLIL